MRCSCGVLFKTLTSPIKGLRACRLLNATVVALRTTQPKTSFAKCSRTKLTRFGYKKIRKKRINAIKSAYGGRSGKENNLYSLNARYIFYITFIYTLLRNINLKKEKPQKGAVAIRRVEDLHYYYTFFKLGFYPKKI